MLPSHPILTCAAAKTYEAALLRDEVSEWAAMQRAGAAIARGVGADFREIGDLPASARLLVLAGKGHNGGDALLAAQALLDERPSATAKILFAFGRDSLRPLARRAFDELAARHTTRVREVDAAVLQRELTACDVVLDGVFGFQCRPPLDVATAELLAWVNTHPRIRLRAAVDLPSGLGEPANAATVFRADFTYCTGIVKAPVVDPVNATHVGRARYLDLGFFRTDLCQPVSALVEPAPGAASPAATFAPAAGVLLPAIVAPLAALRPALSDKRTYGHLVIVGGSLSYPGAVLMTVQAALRSGVGLLTACVPESLVPEYAAKFPEAMWVGFKTGASGGLTGDAVPLIAEKTARATALLLGPGLGAAPETLAAVEAICRNTANSLPLVLDADAIRPQSVRAAAGKRIVLTPHAGEWERLGGSIGLRTALGTAPASEAIAVLKGCPTRIERFSRRSAVGATPDAVVAGASYYSFHGGPVLARGGSGDLLAGLIGGLAAQAPADLLLAAARGVVWHGCAADLLARARGQVAVQTTQLLEYLQPALSCTDHEDP